MSEITNSVERVADVLLKTAPDYIHNLAREMEAVDNEVRGYESLSRRIRIEDYEGGDDKKQILFLRRASIELALARAVAIGMACHSADTTMPLARYLQGKIEEEKGEEA